MPGARRRTGSYVGPTRLFRFLFARPRDHQCRIGVFLHRHHEQEGVRLVVLAAAEREHHAGLELHVAGLPVRLAAEDALALGRLVDAAQVPGVDRLDERAERDLVADADVREVALPAAPEHDAPLGVRRLHDEVDLFFEFLVRVEVGLGEHAQRAHVQVALVAGVVAVVELDVDCFRAGGAAGDEKRGGEENEAGASQAGQSSRTSTSAAATNSAGCCVPRRRSYTETA